MTRAELLVVVGRRLRDTSNSLYTKELIYDGFDKAVDRIKQEIPTLKSMTYFTDDVTDLTYLPEQWHEMLGVYATYYAFAMDERLYESQLSFNEFEGKLESLAEKIESGEITIYNPSGDAVLVDSTGAIGQITDNYYSNNGYDTTADGRYNTSDYNTASDGETVQG